MGTEASVLVLIFAKEGDIFVLTGGDSVDFQCNRPSACRKKGSSRTVDGRRALPDGIIIDKAAGEHT